MKPFQTYKISANQPDLTVEQYLRQVLNYSGRKIQQLTRRKGIRLNGRTAFLQKKLRAGDTLRIMVLTDTGYGVKPEAGNVDILYEDDQVIVLNKPARLLVHPAGQTSGGTLANFLAHNLASRKIVSVIRPLHRLDRDTSGCVIFAKNATAQTILERQLKDHSLKRLYWALVKGTVNQAGVVNAPIGPDPLRPNRRIVTAAGEAATTRYQIIEKFTKATLLELELETGRTHQIRVHLAQLGYPVVGDAMYGARSAFMQRQALHATSVTFNHPLTNQAITVTAPLPEDFSRLLDHCRLTEEQIP